MTSPPPPRLPDLPPRLRLKPGVSVHHLHDGLVAIGTQPGRSVVLSAGEAATTLAEWLHLLHGRSTTAALLRRLPEPLRATGELILRELQLCELADVPPSPPSTRPVWFIGDSDLATVCAGVAAPALPDVSVHTLADLRTTTIPTQAVLVMCGEPGVDSDHLTAHLLRGGWHQLALVHDGGGEVYPLDTGGGPCLGCRQLYLSASDQLFAFRTSNPRPVTPHPPGVMALVAGLVVAELYAGLTGQLSPAAGQRRDIGPGASTVTAHPVTHHPHCRVCRTRSLPQSRRRGARSTVGPSAAK